MEYYEIIHTSSEIATVGELLRKPASIFFGIEILEFLNFRTTNNGDNNLDRITNFYDEIDEEINAGKPYDKMTLKIGTILIVPKEKASKTALFLEGGIKTKGIFNKVFKASALAKLEKDIGYSKKYTNYSYLSKNYNEEGLKSEHPDISVWIWCRSLSNASSPDMTGQLIDISPFVRSINTNVAGDTGGNFSITLPPIHCAQDDNGLWYIPDTTLSYFKNQDGRLNYISNSNLFSDDSFFTFNWLLFHTIIKANDVVFIRFETLKIEERDRITSELKIALSEAVLPGKIYDMIGLVDSNNQQINFGVPDALTTITGRDLTKILIEDGSYFFPTEFAGVGIDVSSATEDRRSLRLPNTGALVFLSSFASPSIEDCLKFVLNNLTSIKVVPDSLFQYYDDNLSFQQIEPQQQQNQNRLKKQEIFKESCLFIIETIRRNRELSYSLEEQNYVLQIFETLNIYITRAYSQKLAIAGLGIIPPFIDLGKQVKRLNEIPTLIFDDLFVLDDTKTYYRLDNLDIELILKIIDYVAVTFEIIQNGSFERSLSKSKGIMSIVNLNIDPSIANRQVIDSSLATANGSILNYIRKICQRPFVEFFGDTYGDKYHFTVRKPPFDRESYAYLAKIPVTNVELKKQFSDIGKEISGPKTVLVEIEFETNNHVFIEVQEVISESLAMNDSEIYTWYQITPQNLQFGQGNDIALAYLPIKGFQEYIDIWGNKPYQIQHNYSPYNPNLLQENPNLLSEIEKQTYLDLVYMIESTAYLPFTRKGTITIAGGNRTLKKGNFVQYYTGEMFYVEAVQHSYSVDVYGVISRSTTIQVSRGMIQAFIRGVEQNGTLYSYFNIINAELDLSQTKIANKIENTEVVKKKIKEALADVPGLTLKNQPTATATKVSKAFIERLKGVGGEDFRSSPYADEAGLTKVSETPKVYTIGYGHQIMSFEKNKYISSYNMSRVEAQTLLEQDVTEREYIVNRAFPNVNQNQFDAIFSFVYNTCKTLAGFNGKQFRQFREAIKLYLQEPNLKNLSSLRAIWINQSITARGRVSIGLINRRTKEFNLFANNEQLSDTVSFFVKTDEVLVETEVTNETISTTYTEIDRQKILSNLKVNPKVFNFFLRGGQFSNNKYITQDSNVRRE